MLNKEEKQKIINLLDDGFSIQQISVRLSLKVSVIKYFITQKEKEDLTGDNVYKGFNIEKVGDAFKIGDSRITYSTITACKNVIDTYIRSLKK